MQDTARKTLPGIIIVAVFFVLLFVYVKYAGPVPFTVNSIATNPENAFTVTGNGTVDAKPDIATVSLGVTANGSTVKQVQDQLNAAINQVSAAVKKAGVADADIQTTNYSINPNYDYSTSPQKITGYTASADLSVKVHNLDNVNQVIDNATAAGANQVGGLTFDVSNKIAAQNTARQKAVADAKEKAQDAAQIAGFHLGRIINYSEDFGEGIVPRPIQLGTYNAAAQAVPAPPPTQVQPGSTEINVTVTLSYQID